MGNIAPWHMKFESDYFIFGSICYLELVHKPDEGRNKGKKGGKKGKREGQTNFPSNS